MSYKKKSLNYYQLKKLIGFFDKLQANSLVKFFSRKHYRSLVTIPEVNLRKDKSWVADGLFHHTHPFSLPVEKKLTKNKFEV